MKIEVLGSGGSVVTPKPFCDCTSCSEARAKGITYSRYGPSVFIHGPDILIDTPEEIIIQLNRSRVTDIKACFYSHWHPDHTSGRRLFEINTEWYGQKPKNKKTPVVLTEKIASTFNEYLSLMTHLNVLQSQNLIEIEIIPNSGTYEINGYTIEPIQLTIDFVFGYKISNSAHAILIIMDELKNWIPTQELNDTHFDAVYLPFGIFDINPITNKINIDPNDPVLEFEQTITETLDVIKKLQSKKFILSHIEEPDNITIKLGKELSAYYSEKMNKNIEIAYDSMIIEA